MVELTISLRYSLSVGTMSFDTEVTEARKDLCDAIDRLVQVAVCKLSETPRMARATASAKLADRNDSAKAAWVVLYWGGLERKDLDDWGFAAP